MIQDREKYLVEGGEPTCITDLFLLESSKEDCGRSFNRSQLYHLQADLFGAGLETSMHTVLFVLLFLCSKEFIGKQKQIQEQLDTECSASEPSLAHKLPLLRAVILEVQRLRPVTPLGVPHGTLETTQVGSWSLPSSTMVIYLHWQANRDASVWSEPEKFVPERFLSEDGSLIETPGLYPFQVSKVHK